MHSSAQQLQVIHSKTYAYLREDTSPMEQPTPSLVLYSDLKTFGRITYRDAAWRLLSSRPAYDGLAPRDRVNEKTFLSREVVHAQPGALPESFFADFGSSAQGLVAQMTSQMRHARNAGVTAAEAHAAISSHYLGEAARSMRAALDASGADGALYSNTAASIAGLRLNREEDRATIAVLAFVAAGCLGSPGRAVQLTEEFMRKSLALSFSTIDLASTDLDTPRGQGDAPVASGLGLVRLVNGAMTTSIYRLSAAPEGSVVGAFATGPNAIIDVGPTVSRQHLRIWLDASGRWLCQGLGSTNGSYITRADGRIVVVEFPRSRRTTRELPAPVELLAGDTIQLGSDTTFAVMPLAPE